MTHYLIIIDHQYEETELSWRRHSFQTCKRCVSAHPSGGPPFSGSTYGQAQPVTKTGHDIIQLRSCVAHVSDPSPNGCQPGALRLPRRRKGPRPPSRCWRMVSMKSAQCPAYQRPKGLQSSSSPPGEVADGGWIVCG